MLTEQPLAALGRRAKSVKFDLNNPHDSIFQAILSDRLRSQAVLRAHLEPWQVDLLTDELPVPLDRSFVDEELRSSQSDKLFEVRLRDGQPGFVYALLEHKSYPDPGTALQVMDYKVRILKCTRRVARDGCGRCRRSSRWCSITGRSLGQCRVRWRRWWRRRTSGCGLWSRRSATTCGS